MKQSVVMLSVAVLVFGAGAMMCAAQTVYITDFALATPDYSDGYGAGFKDFGGSGYDTTQGWTLYIDESFSTVNPITIPFAPGGSITIGELEIREGYELQTERFNLSAGSTHTLALRSQSYDVLAGPANVDWVATGGNLNGYFSQDGGLTWTGFTKGADFTVAAGTMQVLLAKNTGVDTIQEPNVYTVTVSTPSPPAGTVFIIK